MQLSAERKALMKRVDSWNERLHSSLVAQRLDPLRVSDAAAAQPAVVAGPEAVGRMCDPLDPDPKFHMRPADVVCGGVLFPARTKP